MKKLNYKELGKLVERAKSGDPAAFGAIYAATYEAQYYLALQILRNPDDAEDILQETYLRLYRSLDQIRTPQAMIAYLNRINYNQCLTLKEKNARRTHVSSEDNYAGLQDMDPSHDPALHLENKLSEDYLSDVLLSMPENLRVILILRYVEGMKLKDIASVLELSLSTVKRHVHLAKKTLEKLLKQSKGGILLMALLNRDIIRLFAESQARLAPSGQTAGSILSHTFASLSMPDLSFSVCRREASLACHPGHAPAAKAAVAACTAGAAAAGGMYTLQSPDLQIKTSYDLASPDYTSDNITAVLDIDSPLPLKSLHVYGPDDEPVSLTKAGTHSYRFLVTENGQYTLQAVNAADSTSEKILTVSCIDKETPQLSDYRVVPQDSITVYFSDTLSGIDLSQTRLTREDGSPVPFTTDSNNNYVRFDYTTETLYLTVYDHAGNKLTSKVSTKTDK